MGQIRWCQILKPKLVWVVRPMLSFLWTIKLKCHRMEEIPSLISNSHHKSIYHQLKISSAAALIIRLEGHSIQIHWWRYIIRVPAWKRYYLSSFWISLSRRQMLTISRRKWKTSFYVRSLLNWRARISMIRSSLEEANVKANNHSSSNRSKMNHRLNQRTMPTGCTALAFVLFTGSLQNTKLRRITRFKSRISINEHARKSRRSTMRTTY